MNCEFAVEPARHLAPMLKPARHRYCQRLAHGRTKFDEAVVHHLRAETRQALALLDLSAAQQEP